MSSAQQRSAVPLDQQSVLPTVRGVPWWGAVLVATVITGIGAAIDASNSDSLGAVFKFCYLVGCVAAALAVRRRALFTAAAQPPLIAFLVGVIALYGLNADQASSGLKSLIFKVLLPIANDFPWMALTFVVTLGLVLARWYLTRTPSGGGSRRAAAPAKKAAMKNGSKPGTSKPGMAKPGPSATGVKAKAGDSESAAAPTTAKKTARRAKPGPRPTSAAERPDTPTSADGSPPRRTPTKRPKEDSGTATAAPPTRRRSTAGAVYRAGAGEQIDAIDQPSRPVTAPTPSADAGAPAGGARRATPSSAVDHDRYESVARKVATPSYQSIRSRNRA